MALDLGVRSRSSGKLARDFKLSEEPGQIVENDPKTSSGRRSLSLPDFVVEELRAHKIRQNAQRLKAGAAWVDHGLVFTNRHRGYTNGTLALNRFKRALRVANLPDMRIHDLRHSLASILLAIGIHPKVVQEILGHSSIVTLRKG